MSFPHPTRRQGHLFWTALSGLAIAVLAGLIVLLVWGLGRVLDILSPVLWPLAVAGVVAYLLAPVIGHHCRGRGGQRDSADCQPNAGIRPTHSHHPNQSHAVH